MEKNPSYTFALDLAFAGCSDQACGKEEERREKGKKKSAF
jgi:hypothetical protein